jgi:cytochrome oxidase assembly protein ShyY1
MNPPRSSRRWPIVPTIFVALACLIMVALGVWQLGRAQERDAQAATFRANHRNAAMVAYPELPPVPDNLLYRRSSVTCLEVTGWQPSGGTAADGSRGFRFIAQCRTGAEGPGVLVDMGVSSDAQFRPEWTGGPVAGRITLMPDEHGWFVRLFRNVPPPRPLLVAEQAAPGLIRSAPPDPTTRENSSWAYAGQWFFFALAAASIYVLALRRRWQSAEVAAPPPQG